MIEEFCPCCSGKTYENCCKPYHKGLEPKDALSLMRSRYSAYFYSFPEYIINTTHKQNVQYNPDLTLWKQEILDFCRLTDFESLEIIDFSSKNSEASVTFIAHLIQNGEDVSFWEKSLFKKYKGKWLYLKGEVKPAY